jgi:DNA-binding transcriptional ArsR family regulator
MIVEQMVRVDIAAGSGPSLLLTLAGARELEPTGETWLNLLGVPLDAGPPYSRERLLEALAGLDPVELRRKLLGRYAWSWCGLVGADVIDAAAAGDKSVFDALLEHPRYYGGHAHEALAALLPLSPAETHRRILQTAEGHAARVSEEGTAVAERVAATLIASAGPLEAVERLTGYRYVPEPEADRVVLIPHLQPQPSLVLAQHRGARLIVYSAGPEPASEARLAHIGRALADPKRVEILSLVGRGVEMPAELVEATGLTRSTVHHHLVLLREAGLVGLEGNARSYRYVPRAEAAAELEALLAEVLRR